MLRIMTTVIFLFSCFFSHLIYAHGSMEIPISRIYNCYKEGPENVQSEACKAVVAAGGKQPLYDWDMINQFNANDQHRQIIPDGKLCAGGQDKYVGMNLARTDWVTTTIKPDADGKFNFVFRATVPHAVKYFELYMTKDSYNLTQPLKWSDLEDQPFCRYTTLTLDNGRYNLNCTVAGKSGRKIIFGIWQRSDSAEAFYMCSDVIISNDSVAKWNMLKEFVAYHDVKVGSKVVFWLMKDCTALESYTVTLASGQNTANNWPYYLAQEVNAKSSFVSIGQLNSQTGNVTPVMSANQNKVYVKDTDTSHYFFLVDFLGGTMALRDNSVEKVIALCKSNQQMKQ